MASFISTPLTIGSLNFVNRLIQGPLAGFSCAPFRELFYQFTAPAYCVTEMISAQDILTKHALNSRYLYRGAKEQRLCYQIAGTAPNLMTQAAVRLEELGADLIDINCGCPKAKIRKKGAGSALLEKPEQLIKIVEAVRKAIRIPLTIKLRIQRTSADFDLAKRLEQAGIDALIVHGRRWTENYDKPSDLGQIAQIKQSISIPVIANGDIADHGSLKEALIQTGCDAYMIARAGMGKPWLYQTLLNEGAGQVDLAQLKNLFMQHVQSLARLESDYKALLQSKSLVRYYFKNQLNSEQLQAFYQLEKINDIAEMLTSLSP